MPDLFSTCTTPPVNTFPQACLLRLSLINQAPQQDGARLSVASAITPHLLLTRQPRMSHHPHGQSAWCTVSAKSMHSLITTP